MQLLCVEPISKLSSLTYARFINYFRIYLNENKQNSSLKPTGYLHYSPEGPPAHIVLTFVSPVPTYQCCCLLFSSQLRPKYCKDVNSSHYSTQVLHSTNYYCAELNAGH
ncbi:hypothetical protein KIL84_020034 [Mauremys mutica]|uniref:Uncharacterized protein n=1 Tax=Mauremys mutica TaxID=74926 RepID=A0A9D3XY23_9SAUR|nr:hypothetical protein KIL84_020034 [Mauremys mutica]